MRPVRHLTHLTRPPAPVAQAFRRDPADWLPAPVLLHGAEQFHCSVGWRGLRVVVGCRVGGAWVRDGTVSRRVELDGNGSWLEPWLPLLEGDLDVEAGLGGGTVLRFVGHWTRPRAMLVRPVGAILARAVLRRFVEACGHRLDQPEDATVGPTVRDGGPPPRSDTHNPERDGRDE